MSVNLSSSLNGTGQVCTGFSMDTQRNLIMPF